MKPLYLVCSRCLKPIKHIHKLFTPNWTGPITDDGAAASDDGAAPDTDAQTAPDADSAPKQGAIPVETPKDGTPRPTDRPQDLKTKG